MRRAALLIAVTILQAVLQFDSAVAATRAENKAVIDSVFTQNTNKYVGNPDVLVLPGLLADRVEKQVRFFAETTGITSNDPAEFLLIGENSGHAYEAIAVSFVKPSDIHKALEFIGLKPGHPVCPEKLCFWPKGERVNITFRWHSPVEPGAAVGTAAPAAAPAGGTNAVATNATETPPEPTPELRQARAETLMIDKRTGRLFPQEGYVFTGSAVITNAANAAGNGYAADVSEPNSIVSHYNDMETVLDVPRRAPQRDVYLSQYPNPEYMFSSGMLVAVVMQPENAAGKQRVLDFSLKVSVSNMTDISSNVTLFSLSEANGTVLADREPFSKLPALFEKYIAMGRDPFVTVEFDGQLTLREAAAAAKLLAAIDGGGGIRIEPPPAGQLYYMAMLAPEQFRDRASRHIHPWEYHLSATNGTVSGVLIMLQEVRADTGSGWVFKENRFDAATPDALKAALATRNERGMPIGPPAIYVYAPATMNYADVVQLVAPSLDTHPTVYVYLEQ